MKVRVLFFASLVFLSSVILGNGSFYQTSIYQDTVPFSARLLSEYIQIESITGNEREAGIFLSNFAKNAGLHVEIFTDEIDSYNFAASLYPLSYGKPNIIFLNHIDVVPADSVPGYRYPPFSGAIAEGKVWGRGAIDNKGQAVMQILAIIEFVDLARKNDLPYNITMLSVSGEEVGGLKGAKIITESFLDILNPVVVYGEGGIGLPGVLERHPNKEVFGVSVASKRSLWLKLTLDMEVSGHGSVPPVSYAVQEKVNALHRVVRRNHNRIVRFTDPSLEMFREIGELEGGIRGMLLRNIRVFRPFVVPQMKNDEIIYSLVSNTITLTGIYTKPGPPNNIPQQVTAILDCRLLPEVSTEEFVEKIKEWLYNDQIEIEIIHEGIAAKPTVADKYFDKMKEAILSVYTEGAVIKILAPASNDNNYFRAKGIPAYGILPVFMTIDQISSIHNINERMPIDLLEIGIEVHKNLINIVFQDYLNITQN